MIGTYGSAVLIIVAAVVLGRGICVLAGDTGTTALAAPVGFAAMMALCEVGISLPGRGWTAVVVVMVGCLASIWLGVRRRAGWQSLWDAVPISLAMLVVLSVPFIANDRAGILGVSLNNDSHWHLLLAEHLRRPAISAYGYGPGYPLGPHAIAATFAQATGSDVNKTLTGMLMATPVLTALTALGALADVSRWRRWLVAMLAGIPYLAAAWYVQSAFKEPILSLLLLGLVLALAKGRRAGFARPVASLIPLAVLIAGALYDYSYPGLLWPLAIVASWSGLELLFAGAGNLRVIARGVRGALGPLALAVGLLVALVAPDIARIHEFWITNGGTSAGNYGGITQASLGNLVAPLRGFEGLNVWLSGDFRFPPANSLNAGVLIGLALLVLVFAVVSALERRELAWVAGLLGCGLAYAYAQHGQSPYVVAKALVIPAPLLMLTSGRQLMLALQRADWRLIRTVAVAGAAVVFFVFAFQSSYLSLRDAFVGPENHFNQLRALRPLLHGQPTLVLVNDQYVSWELLGVPASSPLLPSPVPAGIRRAKPFTLGQAMDFDSVDAGTLDRFAYVISTNTDAQSQPPPNFHLVGRSRSYEVWQRVGPTPPHRILAESGAPGAMLNCGTDTGHQIAGESGVAMVRTRPSYFPFQSLRPGRHEQLAVSLAAGTWDLSLQFTADQAVTLRGAGMNAHLPPNKDGPGNVWPVGRFTSAGQPVVFTLAIRDPGLVHSDTQSLSDGKLIAVSPGPDQAVPLRQACGRYVDWYTIA